MTYDYSSVSSCNATLPGPSLQTLCSAAEYIVFMTAFDEAIRANPKISRSCEQITSVEEPDDEYDFIVIGAGAGGAVVAARLAEIHNWTILVLEAGGEESAAGQIPSMTGPLMGSEIDWNYYTTNESNHCLSSNGSCYWSMAKSIGGNTAHNGMVYLRGNPTDYNQWADQGNEGWSWEDVLPYFKKAEDNADIDEVGYEYHSTGGPLPVGRPKYVSEFAEDIISAAEQSRVGISEDLNGEDRTGFTIAQLMQKDGVRVSSATAYLRPIRNHENLHISLESTATKVIIENSTAVAVVYEKNGELKTVRARKEIVISAGTVRSPQLLLLSGIGPKEHLESVGVDVVANLPGVGENIHDHISHYLTFTTNQKDMFVTNELVAAEYLQNQTGPMSVVQENQLVGETYTNRTTAEYPDLQFQIYAYAAECAPGEVGALRSDGNRTIKIKVNNLHPQSRGRISLASNNFSDHPVIWNNYLGEEVDTEVLLDGIDFILELVETEALKDYGLELSETPFEVCSDYTIPSREYWTCDLRQASSADLHVVGTCKMGPASDPMAVVDPQLRVHGIKNLRVVDASVMPTVPSSNTAAPTIMIGERGADFIKNDWFSSESDYYSYI